MSHFITRCIKCQQVVTQCRCPSPSKEQRWVDGCNFCIGHTGPAVAAPVAPAGTVAVLAAEVIALREELAAYQTALEYTNDECLLEEKQPRYSTELVDALLTAAEDMTERCTVGNFGHRQNRLRACAKRVRASREPKLAPQTSSQKGKS